MEDAVSSARMMVRAASVTGGDGVEDGVGEYADLCGERDLSQECFFGRGVG